MNYTSLAEISYPIFKLGLNKPSEVDGVYFYYYERETEEGATHTVVRILDDKNIELPTLSKRRLQILSSGAKLFRLRLAIFFLGDLIKLAIPRMWFIDSNGKIFQYVKTTRAKLKIYPIKALYDIEGGGVIVEAEGLPTRFKSLFRPDKQCRYVGILHITTSRVLYAFYEHPYEETWRKV